MSKQTQYIALITNDKDSSSNIKEKHIELPKQNGKNRKSICSKILLILSLILLFVFVARYVHYAYIMKPGSYVVTEENFEDFKNNYQNIIQSNTIITFSDTKFVVIEKPIVLDSDITIVFGEVGRTAIRCPDFDAPLFQITNKAVVELKAFRLTYCFYLKSQLFQVDSHSSLTLSDAEISYSSTKDNIPLIKCDSSQLLLNDVDIDGNLATKSHFLEISSSFLTIYNSRFDSNTIIGDGADGLINGMDMQIKISYAQVIGNDALDGDGSFIYCQTCLVAIQDSIFKRNKAANGGCISISENSMLDVYDSEFYNNAATFSGGCVMANNSETFIYGIKMNENVANVAAGIAADTGSIVIDGSVFADNIGTVDASVHYIKEALSDIKDSFFTNNVCPGGKAIDFDEVYQGRFQNCTFMLNSGESGAISSLQSRTEIKGCHFEQNKANSSAVCTVDKSSTFFITESFFTSNQGKLGSCFEIMNASSVIVENSLLTNNKADLGSITYIGGTSNAFVLKGSTAEGNVGEDTSPFVYEEFPGKNIIIIDNE